MLTRACLLALLLAATACTDAVAGDESFGALAGAGGVAAAGSPAQAGSAGSDAGSTSEAGTASTTPAGGSAGAPASAGSGGSAEPQAGQAGAPSAGSGGSASAQGGAAGSSAQAGGPAVDPLAPVPAANCPGYIDILVPLNTCVWLHGATMWGQSPSCSVIEPEKHSGTCGTASATIKAQTLRISDTGATIERFDLDPQTGLCPHHC